MQTGNTNKESNEIFEYQKSLYRVMILYRVYDDRQSKHVTNGVEIMGVI